jgi:alkylhydroperoxidase family enzyme
LTAEASANESGEALYKIFNDEQVVEITLVTAMANFTNRFNNGLGVQPEQ